MSRSHELDFGDVPDIFRLMKSIFSHAERIQDLSLEASEVDILTGFASMFMPHFRDHFVNLNHLVVAVHPYDDVPDILIKAFSASPLRGIEIYSPGDRYCLQRLPYANLTDIAISTTDVLVATKIVSDFPSLRRAKFALRPKKLPESISLHSLTHMHSLDITVQPWNYSDDSYSDFINLLTCPALTYLALGLSEYSDGPIPVSGTFPQAVASFAKRSPQIQTFRLMFTTFDDEELLMILEQMTEVVVFDFVQTPFVSGTLMKEIGFGRVMPKLNDLRIAWYAEKFDWEAWLDMVSSRWALKEQALGSVYLRLWQNEVPRYVRDWVREMQLAGRAVKILSVHTETEEIYRYAQPDKGKGKGKEINGI
ncbi:hypothetical protein VNI00_012984 [Paramarasmius palmivorus]|uniref:Uncharacterized protein n=1 Tax=Paramarasmius palmivorus TaxID=297713 RepID=A0AAW0C1G9_9AGAR